MLRINLISGCSESCLWGTERKGPESAGDQLEVCPCTGRIGKTWKENDFEEGFPWIWGVREKKEISGRRFYIETS